MRTIRIPALGLFLITLTPWMAKADTPPLVAETPIAVPGSGGFDFLQVDAEKRRLLACHTGNGTLDVFELDSGKLLKQVATGKAQDVAVNAKADQYLVSVSKEKRVVLVDARTLLSTGEIGLGGEADAMTFNPKNQCAYVAHDHAPELWVVDPHAQKVTNTIQLPGEPEVLCYDAGSDRIFQNVVSRNSVAVIDPTKNEVKVAWPIVEATKPHGLALDVKHHWLATAGANGKLAVLNTVDGGTVKVVAIAEGVDQIALDADYQRVYCASRQGWISVVELKDEGPVSLGNIKTATGAKTIAVDPKTHAVWVAYADQGHSYVLRLRAEK